jgi:hypothetical protein
VSLVKRLGIWSSLALASTELGNAPPLAQQLASPETRVTRPFPRLNRCLRSVAELGDATSKDRYAAKAVGRCHVFRSRSHAESGHRSVAPPRKLKSAPFTQKWDTPNTSTAHSKEARRLIAPIRKHVFNIDPCREQGSKFRNLFLHNRRLSPYGCQNG